VNEINPTEWPRPSRLTRSLSWWLNPGGAPSERRLRAVVAGKTALITGASSGIGDACARLIASAGAKVLLVARSREQLEAVAAGIQSQGGVAEIYPTDLTDTDAVAALGNRCSNFMARSGSPTTPGLRRAFRTVGLLPPRPLSLIRMAVR